MTMPSRKSLRSAFVRTVIEELSPISCEIFQTQCTVYRFGNLERSFVKSTKIVAVS